MPEFSPLAPGDTFPLWLINVRGVPIITRGRTPEEAQHYVPGDVYNVCPIDLPRWYGRNHRPGWLETPMYWLCEHLGLDPADYGHQRAHPPLGFIPTFTTTAQGGRD